MIFNNVNLEEVLSSDDFKNFEPKLNHPVEDQKYEAIVVYNFIFPDGNSGQLVGNNKGVEIYLFDLEDWEVPLVIHTDTDDYCYFTFDDRNSEMENEPTFSIGDTDYYYKILRCFKTDHKVDPKTGNLIVLM